MVCRQPTMPLMAAPSQRWCHLELGASEVSQIPPKQSPTWSELQPPRMCPSLSCILSSCGPFLNCILGSQCFSGPFSFLSRLSPTTPLPSALIHVAWLLEDPDCHNGEEVSPPPKKKGDKEILRNTSANVQLGPLSLKAGMCLCSLVNLDSPGVC